MKNTSARLQQISPMTTSTADIVNAIQGLWGRSADNGSDTTWCVLGRVVFVQGNTDDCPVKVIAWNSCDGGGSWGIVK